jgi:membrane protein
MKKNYQSVNEQTRGAFDILKRTIERFGRVRTPEAAAGMAFFGLFSLFPLLLVLVSMGGSFLNSPQAQDQVLDILMEVFPFSVDIVEENVQKVLIARGSVQIFGFLGLAWSATGAFTVLTRNINSAWPNADRHNFLKMRLMAFTMLAGVAVVMVVLVIANTAIRFLPQSVRGIAALIISMQYFSRVVILVLTFIALLWLYRWIPNTNVLWTEAAWGALIAALGTVLATTAFSWYLGSGHGLSNYNLVYGSLGAIVALMFWIYLVSYIVLFGAHLSSSIAYCTRIKKASTGVEEQ